MDTLYSESPVCCGFILYYYLNIIKLTVTVYIVRCRCKNTVTTLEMKRIKCEVNGHILFLNKAVIDAGPPSRLQTMCTNEVCTINKPCLVIDRPMDVFTAVLTMYQTGELHMPKDSCPLAFMKELEFWEIQPEMLSSCCLYRLKCFLDKHKTLDEFQASVFKEDVSHEDSSETSCFTTFRQRLWSVVGQDNTRKSVCAKVYVIISTMMILLSILTLALSTDAKFQRTMDNCERLEYMHASHMSDIALVADVLTKHCHDNEIPKDHKYVNKDTYLVDKMNDTDNMDEFTYMYVEDSETHVEMTGNGNNTQRGSDKDTERVNEGNTSMVQDNDSRPHAKIKWSDIKRVKLPNKKIRIFAMNVLELIAIVFFTADFISRLLSCPCHARYFKSVTNVADAMAIICIYLHMLVLQLRKQEKYEDGWVDILESIQIIRSFRLFRVIKNVRASGVLVYTITKNAKDILMFMLFLIVAVCTLSSIVYISENRKTIESIPVAWYWAVITMTSVGYGDVTPTSGIGRVVACLCAISGLFLFAFTVSMFTNNFFILYNQAGLEGFALLNERPCINDKSQIYTPVSVDSPNSEIDTNSYPAEQIEGNQIRVKIERETIVIVVE